MRAYSRRRPGAGICWCVLERALSRCRFFLLRMRMRGGRLRPRPGRCGGGAPAAGFPAATAPPSLFPFRRVHDGPREIAVAAFFPTLFRTQICGNAPPPLPFLLFCNAPCRIHDGPSCGMILSGENMKGRLDGCDIARNGQALRTRARQRFYIITLFCLFFDGVVSRGPYGGSLAATWDAYAAPPRSLWMRTSFPEGRIKRPGSVNLEAYVLDAASR